MSEPRLIVTGRAGRYAFALFTLAQEAHRVDAVAHALDLVLQALNESGDFQRLVRSPTIDRSEAARCVSALAALWSLDPLVAQFLGVLAHNRRLADLAAIGALFHQYRRHAQGESIAEVTSARPLSAPQQKALTDILRTRFGRAVTLAPKVDPSLLGGLVVKIGSKVIDSSLKTKLESLSLAMTKPA